MLSLVTMLVDDYDQAIDFYVDVLGFELVEDSPSTTNAGAPKRWVVVRPHNAETGLLLAKADGERQQQTVGAQVGGRVGFFLSVDDFDRAYSKLIEADVEIVSTPRSEPYGRVAVFADLYGNRWDLLGPAD